MTNTQEIPYRMEALASIRNSAYAAWHWFTTSSPDAEIILLDENGNDFDVDVDSWVAGCSVTVWQPGDCTVSMSDPTGPVMIWSDDREWWDRTEFDLDEYFTRIRPFDGEARRDQLVLLICDAMQQLVDFAGAFGPQSMVEGGALFDGPVAS